MDNSRLELSANIEGLIARYREIATLLEIKTKVAAIHVDEIASKIAFFYEKIRKIIDWKEENLIRRGSIERILKRRLISEISGFSLISDSKPEKIAEPMVLELIRGGHFPNDAIPRIKISEVEKALEKYIYILSNNPVSKDKKSMKVKKKINLYNWVLEIAACEIEEILDPSPEENALINFMTKVLKDRIKADPGLKLSEEERVVQIYIAVHRSLFHIDSPLIAYHLIKLRLSEWKNPDENQREKIAQNIFEIWEKTEEDLSHRCASEFQKICEKYDTIYLIIGDIFKEFLKKPAEMKEVVADKTKFLALIKDTYDKRLKTLRSRLYRAAIYSTLSIFVAGGFSLFIFEVPIARIFYGRFSPLAILADLIIPTVVMFILVSAIKLPGENNFNRVVEEIDKITYKGDSDDVYEIRAKKKGNIIAKIIITLLYIVTSLGSLWGIFWLFYVAKVPITSLFINTLNVAMIVFAALVIRQRAKEMTIEERATFWEFILDMLSIPIAKLGQWLSKKWREYNIVSVFFTALVDIPFSGFIEFVESWSSFLKEKKAEIQQ